MRAGAWLCALLLAGCAATGFDPATMDPAPQDPPPSMEPVRLPSGGVPLNGIVYLPGGDGPRPVAILLHGLPGDERNLDLAQALRRAGWAVVFFHYRGAWGSPGSFSFGHVLEDVDAAVAWSRSEAVRERFGLDDGPRALVGHSMGGWAALRAGAEAEGVGCIASLAGANLGGLGARLRDDADLADEVARNFEAWTVGPLAGTSGAALVQELASDPAAFDLRRAVPELLDEHLLLVAGLADAVAPPEVHHTPLVEALAFRDASVRAVTLQGDHAFSGVRIALARTVTSWLRTTCLREPPPRATAAAR